MNLSPEDRVALMLGRAVMRADALQALLEQAQQRIAELEPRQRNRKPPKSSKKGSMR